MNPELMLNLVETAILYRESSPSDRWALILSNQTFRCVPREKLSSFSIVLKYLNATEVQFGLSPKGWESLKLEIEKQLKGKRPCQKPSKPYRS